MHIEEIKDHVGKSVILRGWIYRTRQGKDIVFVVLRDVTGTVQCVVKEGVKGFEDAQKALMEASIMIKGKVNKDERAPGGFEIHAEEFTLIGAALDFPIKAQQSTELLLDNRHLWVRSRKMTNIFKIRSEVFRAIHDFFHESGFFEVQSPSLTGSACEGGSTLFEVKYFDRKAYLTQSWQLYAEAVIASLEKIYCIAPSFRAEKSRTRRHLAEYWHAEAEAAWMDHEGNMKLQEDLITFILKRVVERRSKELKELGRDPKELVKMHAPYKKVKYKEALELLKKDGIKMQYGEDFGADEERELTKHFKKPFFVVEFPKEAKAFYMKENPKDRKTYLCSDMLAPEGYGEIIGGSEREVDVEKLIQRLKKEGSSTKDYEWYFDIRRYGSVPHSGFGLGVERIVMWICKLDHIRDTTAFPRVLNRLYP
ncbi:MAG: asparagine--tRNA ligase [Candidatus Aenigmatarchaeota archaeon]